MKTLENIIDWMFATLIVLGFCFIIGTYYYHIELSNATSKVILTCLVQVDDTMRNASEFCNNFLNK